MPGALPFSPPPGFPFPSSITSLCKSMGSSSVALRHTHTHTQTTFSPSPRARPNLASLAKHERKFKPHEQDDIFTPANPPAEESSVVGRGIRLAVWGPGGFSFQLPCQAAVPSLKDNKGSDIHSGVRATRILTHTDAFPLQSNRLRRR